MVGGDQDQGVVARPGEIEGDTHGGVEIEDFREHRPGVVLVPGVINPPAFHHQEESRVLRLQRGDRRRGQFGEGRNRPVQSFPRPVEDIGEVTGREHAHQAGSAPGGGEFRAVAHHRVAAAGSLGDPVSVVLAIRAAVRSLRKAGEGLAQRGSGGDHRPPAAAQQHFDLRRLEQLVGELRLRQVPGTGMHLERGRGGVGKPHVGHQAGDKAPSFGPFQDRGKGSGGFRVHAQRFGEDALPGGHLGGGRRRVGDDPVVGEGNRVAGASGVGDLHDPKRPPFDFRGVGHPQSQLVHSEPVPDEQDGVARPFPLRARRQTAGGDRQQRQSRPGGAPGARQPGEPTDQRVGPMASSCSLQDRSSSL